MTRPSADGRSQPVVYHFMFAPDREEGCKPCSFWADNFDGLPIHLKHRDVTFTCISRAPFPKLSAYKKRMGWSFPCASSYGSEFNFDYHVSWMPGQLHRIGQFQYRMIREPAFVTRMIGTRFHTYSCYSREIEMLTSAYSFLDLVPKGRDEDGFSFSMAWVRRNDQY